MESNLFHSSIFQIFTANSYLVELLLESHLEEDVSSLGGWITFSLIIYIFIINFKSSFDFKFEFCKYKVRFNKIQEK